MKAHIIAISALAAVEACERCLSVENVKDA